MIVYKGYEQVDGQMTLLAVNLFESTKSLCCKNGCCSSLVEAHLSMRSAHEEWLEDVVPPSISSSGTSALKEQKKKALGLPFASAWLLKGDERCLKSFHYNCLRP